LLKEATTDQLRIVTAHELLHHLAAQRSPSLWATSAACETKADK